MTIQLRLGQTYPELPQWDNDDLRVPASDVEVAAALKAVFGEGRGFVNFRVANLWGIYTINRLQGMSILDAYGDTLMTFLKIADPQSYEKVHGSS